MTGVADAPAPQAAIRSVEAADLAAVIALDAEITGIEKPDYWYELLHRYGTRGRQQRFFLVAVAETRVVGYIIGEVRDWEFGQPPCGWVFGVGIQPGTRLRGLGTQLLDAICAGFRRAGVAKVRTLTSRENNLILSFFRSQGMMAAPFIPLELDLA
ncbi:MAG: GNAT family N-acetyltransferase [Burkholderiales bacterium]|jgi:ribosomal protein S18 acetylase RimI-like enzyme|nr:GNAT family N-acetyltransferase [Burkholderiales bacterium]